MIGKKGGLAQQQPGAVQGAAHAEAGDRLEALYSGQFQLARRGRVAHRARQGMFGTALQGRGQRQQLVLLNAFDRHLRGDRRPALGEGAGLVQHDGVELAGALQGLAVADQDAHLRRAAHADHDGDRRGQPQGAGTGDHQHRHGHHHRVADLRRRAEPIPDDEGDDRDADHDRHEHRRDLVHQAADRGLAGLGLTHRFDDMRQGGVAADARGAHQKAALGVEGAAENGVALALEHRHGFAGEHGFIDMGLAVEHLAIDRDAVTGTHLDGLVQADLGHRHLHLLAIADDQGGARLQADQALDRQRGLAPGLALEGRAQRDQGDDDHRRIEIGMPGLGGHQLGPQQDDGGIQPGGSRAQRHQGVHIAAPGLEAGPGAAKEMSAHEHQHRERDAADAQPQQAGLIQRREQVQQGAEEQHQPHPAGHDGAPPQLTVFGQLTLFLLALVVQTPQLGGVVTALAHRLDQGLGLDALALHQRGPLAEIDHGGSHARDGGQGVLHGLDAAGTAHAGDRQADLVHQPAGSAG